jgi:hypothetical protein
VHFALLDLIKKLRSRPSMMKKNYRLRQTVLVDDASPPVEAGAIPFMHPMGWLLLRVGKEEKK